MADRVLDTDVASFLFKGHSLAARYRPHLRGYTPVVSFMTVAEMYEWALRSRWGPARMARLDATLHTYAVVPSSPDLCRTWAAIRFQRRSRPISESDAWIAAAALALGCELVTHNAADFQGIRGLVLISEAAP